MGRSITVRVGSSQATFRLLDELAPRSTQALWEALPVDATLTHGKLSGDACFLDVEGGPLAALPASPELPETSIYRGYMALFPHPEAGEGELLISYGLAEYRWPTGRRYVCPVGQITAAAPDFLDILRGTHAHGSVPVSIRRQD
ncbi:MAG: DUF3830 family protein [Acidimicrobiales bacterium]